MKTNNPTIRELFDTKIAAKYADDRGKILDFYDKMLEKHNGDELKALEEFEKILLRFTPAAALKAQQERLAQDIAELQKGIEALASVDCSKVLTPAAKQIFNALDGQKISVQSKSDALSRVRELQERAKEQDKKARELEAELQSKDAKPNENGEIDMGMVKLTPLIRANLLEKKETYRSLASAKTLKAGLALDVTFINGR